MNNHAEVAREEKNDEGRKLTELVYRGFSTTSHQSVVWDAESLAIVHDLLKRVRVELVSMTGGVKHIAAQIKRMVLVGIDAMRIDDIRLMSNKRTEYGWRHSVDQARREWERRPHKYAKKCLLRCNNSAAEAILEVDKALQFVSEKLAEKHKHDS